VPGQPAVECAAAFCVSYPSDWDITEATDDFIAFSHPLGDGKALATAAPVNMEALAEAAGQTWPITTQAVVAAFWSLIDNGEAELANVRTMADGSVTSSGTISSGRLWFHLVPTGISTGVGVEVRGPNASWRAHADVFFEGIDILSQ
jgi:hypothetical protein